MDTPMWANVQENILGGQENQEGGLNIFLCVLCYFQWECICVLQKKKGRVQVEGKQHTEMNRQARKMERNVFTRRQTNLIVLISLFWLLNQHTLVAGNLEKTKKYKHENHW